MTIPFYMTWHLSARGPPTVIEIFKFWFQIVDHSFKFCSVLLGVNFAVCTHSFDFTHLPMHDFNINILNIPSATSFVLLQCLSLKVS